MIICGTGHRPDKLGGYGPEATIKLIDLAKDWLGVHLPASVISGMALGWDSALAEAACQLEIPWTAAIPFEGQESRWPKQSQDIYKKTLMFAEKVVYVSEPGYAVWKMQKRNEWMVDNSDLVLALWDGSDGGTANCVRYANKVGKEVVNLWETYDSHH